MAKLNFPGSPTPGTIYTENGNVWKWNGSSWISFNSLDLTSQVAGALGVTYGGTGYSTYTLGDILVGAGSSFIKLPVGSDNFILTASSSSSTGLTWAQSTTTSATGFTTLNNLTSGVQYFSAGTSGSLFNISSSGSTHTFNIPIAGSGATGLVSTQSQTFAGQKTFTSSIIGDLSGTATTSNYSLQSGYGITAGTSALATTSTYSHQAGYAVTSGSSSTASTATYAHQSGYAITAISSTTATSASYWTTPRTLNLSGDLSGSVIWSGSGDTTISATIAANSVALGTDTTGQYASTISASGSGITVTTASADDGTAYTIYSSATSSNNISSIVLRDSSGNFSAGTINASLTGTASTSTYSHQSGYAITSDSSTNSGLATTSTYAHQSGYATTSGSSGTALTAQNINIANASTNTAHPLHFSPSATGTGLATSSNTTLSFNPSSNILSVSGLAVTAGTASTNSSSGALVITGGVGIGGSLFVGGDLIINGTTTTINSVTLTVDDKNIELGSVTSPSDVTAEGGGITLKGLTDKFINWYTGTGWSSSESWNLISGNTYKINNTTVLSASSIGTGITNSSLTALGTITTGVWSGTAITPLYGGTGLQPTFTVGDILYANSSTTWNRLTPGTNGFVLTSAGTANTPTYTNPSNLLVGLATTSSNSRIASAGNSNSAHSILFTPASNTSGSAISSDSTLSFNPSTEILSVSGLAITSGTASTNTTTGALIVRGGLGVTGQLSFATASFGFTGITTNPVMSFIGATSSSPITLTVQTDNSLNWEGSSGSLFSIDNNLSSGEIFAVSDISGLPVISASAGQTVNINEFGGYTQIGNGTINSSTTSNGSLVIAGGLGMTGNANIGGTVRISSGTNSASTSSGSLVVLGGLGITGNAFIGGTTTITNGTNSASTTTGSLVVLGGLGITGNTFIGGTTTVSNGTNSNSSTSGSLVVLGGLGITGNAFIGGTTTVSNGTNSVSSTSGSLVVLGGLGITGNAFIGGTTTITSGTNSFSTATGALVVNGGLGVTGNANIGGTVRISSSTASTSSSNGALSVVGGVGIGQSLFVGGSIFNLNYFYSGGNNFSKSGQAQGDVILDNNSNDTPGVLFYYRNNTNFGIDAYAVGIGATRLRIVRDLNESTGSEIWSIDRTGIVTRSAWDVGETINTRMYDYNELSMSATTTIGITTFVRIANINYTPKSSSSYIWIEFNANYDFNNGTTVDDFWSNITVNGTEIAAINQRFLNASGGGTRSGVLFPISGRYTNSSTSGIAITVSGKRGSADDDLRVFGSSTSGYMRIMEIGR